jgi:serine/threonine protein kinase
MFAEGSMIAGKYRVRRVLAEAGTGVVYATEHGGRAFAVKVLHPEISKNIERFVPEMKRELSVLHPGLVTAIDIAWAGESWCFVSELVEAPDLRSVMNGPMHVDHVTLVGRSIADALSALHRAGRVHRRMAPDDIFFCARPRLLAVPGPSGHETMMTRNPRYDSPERMQGKGVVRPAHDVWGLGCILYEMLSGTAAFDGSGPAQIAAILTKSPPPIERADAPPAMIAAIEACLAKRPEDRPTAEALAAELGR